MSDEAEDIKQSVTPESKPTDGGSCGPDDPDASKPPKALTPEEQMEAYEEALKDSDWGHQPC